ncbi:MAG: MBL fold metallo-hydrolase [Oscillospiraceae bacterium]|nr:MBL fold metallo-hydrolase [Oscillospiraceae bacterium]
MIIAPLCSSSTANSTFIGSRNNGGVLIDAGCSYKALRGYLAKCDLGIEAIRAVLVTHEHSDHISGLRVLTKNCDIPVYASEGTRRVLLEKGLVHNPERLFGLNEDELDTVEVDFRIRAFSTPHDSAESVGFSFTCNNGYKIAYMTDLGEITPEVRSSTLGCDFAVIESNYDSIMLRNNTIYPEFTKERIKSSCGHLSNSDSADYVLELVEKGATRVVLAHLSKQNNTPKIAYTNTVERLARAGLTQGRDYTLNVANVQTNGEYIAV